MKNLLTIFLITLSLGLTTPGAFAHGKGGKGGKGHGNAGGEGVGGNGNGNGFGETEAATIEAAAQTLSTFIAVDAAGGGGSQERYLKYARKLARTLNQKSSAELDRILGSGNHYGLGQ